MNQSLKPSPNLAIHCVQCGGENTRLSHGPLEQLFRDETFTVQAEFYQCQDCDFKTMLQPQLDRLRVVVSDAYRTAHGLLTSKEIVSRRNALGMGQRKFAEFLGVGEASIPRWESWKVQDAIYDQKIRSSTKEEFAPQGYFCESSEALNHLLLLWKETFDGSPKLPEDPFNANSLEGRFSDFTVNWDSLQSYATVRHYGPLSPAVLDEREIVA